MSLFRCGVRSKRKLDYDKRYRWRKNSELLVDGCRTERLDSLATTCRAQVHQPPDFDNTFESAWAIVDCILQNNPQATGRQPCESQPDTNRAQPSSRSDGLISSTIARLWSYAASTPTYSSPTQMTQAKYFKPYSVHSTVLPTLNATLYEALVVNLPLDKECPGYIYAETDHINNTVQELLK